GRHGESPSEVAGVRQHARHSPAVCARARDRQPDRGIVAPPDSFRRPLLVGPESLGWTAVTPRLGTSARALGLGSLPAPGSIVTSARDGPRAGCDRDRESGDAGLGGRLRRAQPQRDLPILAGPLDAATPSTARIAASRALSLANSLARAIARLLP